MIETILGATLFVAVVALIIALKFWPHVVAAREELRRKERHGTVSVAEARLSAIEKWRIYLVVAGSALALGALFVLEGVPKREPPVVEEHLAWLSFFVGVMLCFPFLLAAYSVVSERLRSHGMSGREHR